MNYDALLIASFGGPERPEDVLPFLENVLRGKRVPRERMLEVAKHYDLFGGVSPINAQNRDLKRLLEEEFKRKQLHLPIYWGNRNWMPFLVDTLKEMKADGVQRVIAYVTSAFSSYSGCRQYLEDFEKARMEIGPGAPQVDKLRVFYNHPNFIEVIAQNVQEAFERIPENQRSEGALVFTAHSIPLTMSSASDYVAQLNESCKLVAKQLGIKIWDLVYQSRSGPPTVPWLEPDILAHLESLKPRGIENVVLSPIGFVSDHMEVIYDLDTEAKALCQELGIKMVRAATPGNHPLFVEMIRELVEERLNDSIVRRAIGVRGPNHDVCPPNCCRPL